MCFRLTHFPAHHNDRTSLTPAVISEFKVCEMRQRPGLCPGPRWGAYSAPPDPLAGLGGGEGDEEGGELGKEGREREGRGGDRGKEREGEGEGKGKGRDPAKFREKLTPLVTTKPNCHQGQPKPKMENYGSLIVATVHCA